MKQGFLRTIQHKTDQKIPYRAIHKDIDDAFVSLNGDYCNALPFGVRKYQLDRLQNATPRVTFQIAKFYHITPALIDLHWLPVTRF